jgi:hypothetical protein
MGVQGGCKCRISKPVSLLRLALHCTVLRSRWCQSGVAFTLIELRLCARVLFHRTKLSLLGYRLSRAKHVVAASIMTRFRTKG